MRKVFLVLALAVAITAGIFVFKPTKGRCVYCPSYPCYSSNGCGFQGCKCMKGPYQTSGTCVSFD